MSLLRQGYDPVPAAKHPGQRLAGQVQIVRQGVHREYLGSACALCACAMNRNAIVVQAFLFAPKEVET